MAAGTEQSLDAVRRLARGVCDTPVGSILIPGGGKASPGWPDAISRGPRIARVYAYDPRAPGESAGTKAHCGIRRMRRTRTRPRGEKVLYTPRSGSPRGVYKTFSPRGRVREVKRSYIRLGPDHLAARRVKEHDARRVHDLQRDGPRGDPDRGVYKT